MEKTNNYFMYVLLCGDNSLYGGFTTDLKHRLKQHQTGKGAKYTKSHLPVKMIFSKQFDTKHDALSAEYHFKHQSRKKKIEYLIEQGINVKQYGLKV
ncbi:GIY-YIG nuclease family protein [Apilactobacillus bombintestini]|uniref:GIY-YIG nuclease family protein n=1 Tax=Apilactobacillus bombintestini TaxID=2419772 RepID=A0A387AUR1_9LACO|nr:GIY-YIG nuclease family protein [Apilactobacillus bombintestini]AYF92486.1 GIY-YIG nuclease family protein [Apilactobacillus bombintestini]